MPLFAPGEYLPQLSEHWYQCRPTDQKALHLFLRHYSCRTWRTRQANRFVGPGESLVLLTYHADALFVWRHERYRRDAQHGICCSVFRNESPLLSSLLIAEAMAIAWERWGAQRLFTFVDPRRVRSVNPGCCFKCAGWSCCGTTARHGLIILEAYPGGAPLGNAINPLISTI